VPRGDELLDERAADRAGGAGHEDPRAHGVYHLPSVAMIGVTLYTDAACPWAYSANPALRVLEWRYGEQLDWRLVMIGLREDARELVARGYDPAAAAARQLTFRRRYGMPFAAAPKDRAAGSGRGCRAVVAARLLDPGSEWRVLRALQLANFTTPLLLDDDDRIRAALSAAEGVDADAIVGRLDDPEVTREYERDKAEARSAAGTPAESQGKTSTSDGAVRFTAPSLVFERDGRRLVAGGWQPILAYDVLIANLAPELARTPPPDSPDPLLERFPGGLTTAEVAALLAPGPDYLSDHEAAEQLLVRLVSDGGAVRIPLGQDAVWKAASSVEPPLRQRDAAAVA
jgi:protein-disulfide isomerase-like protein with CxxC motif